MRVGDLEGFGMTATTRSELRSEIKHWTYDAKRAEYLNMHPNFVLDYWNRVRRAKNRLESMDDELSDLLQDKLRRELNSSCNQQIPDGYKIVSIDGKLFLDKKKEGEK